VVSVGAEAPVAFLGRNFSAFAEHNPCDGCSAPCCRMVISPQRAPESFGALDRLRYLVAHESAELLLDPRGRWQLVTTNPCTLLSADNRCSVHGTARKPKICVNYDPHGCWYKRNFHDVDVAPDLIRMDLEAFERVVDQLEFDEDGRITHIPTYAELRRIAEDR
jgi:Fe-S-cluster containining protein